MPVQWQPAGPLSPCQLSWELTTLHSLVIVSIFLPAIVEASLTADRAAYRGSVACHGTVTKQRPTHELSTNITYTKYIRTSYLWDISSQILFGTFVESSFGFMLQDIPFNLIWRVCFEWFLNVVGGEGTPTPLSDGSPHNCIVDRLYKDNAMGGGQGMGGDTQHWMKFHQWCNVICVPCNSINVYQVY